MAVQIRYRRDSAANWTSANPVLAIGEPGFETDTGSYKIGDGTTVWTSLGYSNFSDDNVAALFTDLSNAPSAPSPGNLTLYAKDIANRMFLRQIGPSGLKTALQPFLARNKVGYWVPPGNAAVAPGIFGYVAATTIGTATQRDVAVTNMFTRTRRLGYVSATTANAYAGSRYTQVQFLALAGYFKVIRFGISDAVLASPTNMFVGMSNQTAAPSSGTEPSTLTNQIGIGANSTDTNFKFMFGGSVAQTPIDLGVNFPVNTTNTDFYELAMFMPPSDGSVLYYEVTRINTGDVATGTITGDSNGIQLPLATTMLAGAWHWRGNLATGLAVGLDIMSDYIETDN